MTDSKKIKKTSVWFVKNLFWNPVENRPRAGWRLLAQLALLAILLILTSLPLSLFRDHITRFDNDDNPIVADFIEVNLKLICTIVSLALAGRFLDRRPFKNFGFALDGRWWRDFCFGLGFGVVLMVSIFGIEYAMGWVTITRFFQTDFSSFAAGMLLYIGLFVSIGIQEETIYRGYWLRNIAEGLNFPRVGPKLALLISYGISSCLFSLGHLGNPNASWVSTLGLVLLGLLLGLPYVLTGQLAISIGLHITWNFFQGNVFGFRVSGTGHGTSFIAIQQNGPDLWTGGAFGPEAGLIGLAVMFVVAGLIVFWLKLTHGQLVWCKTLAHYAPVVKNETEHMSE